MEDKILYEAIKKMIPRIKNIRLGVIEKIVEKWVLENIDGIDKLSDFTFEEVLGGDNGMVKLSESIFREREVIGIGIDCMISDFEKMKDGFIKKLKDNLIGKKVEKLCDVIVLGTIYLGEDSYCKMKIHLSFI